MTLRDRLIALADADAVCDDDKPYTRALALAAARMALEDAAQTVAITPLEVVPTFERDKDAANALTALLNSTQIGEKLADAIRALRDSLANV